MWFILFLSPCVVVLQSAHAFEVSFSQGLGGSVCQVTIMRGDSLVELARTYDIGFNEMVAANPDVDPFIPAEGTTVIIPAAWLLPDVPENEGIVINLAEMRLYLFRSRNSSTIETFPIGIGDEGWDTPIGSYRIIEKIENPPWHVPESIRALEPELPKVVPPGPDNPLGTHALRLSIGTVLIHGTNRPFGIGRKVSHGCIHLYPEDIKILFRRVKPGTRVTIIRQQVKAALVNGRVLVEVHVDGKEDLEREALELLERKGLTTKVDLAALQAAVQAGSGMPTDVTRE